MGLPLVSCIMPTAQRPQFVPLAVYFFLRQTYEKRELIVIDDGVDRVDYLIPPNPLIQYYGLQNRSNIGTKRNMACELAKGEIIAHWDDDDWIDSSRLTFQVAAMTAAGAAASGLSSIRYYDPAKQAAWLWKDADSQWFAGGSLCYYKTLWSGSRFREIEFGEDTAFIRDVGYWQFLDLHDAPLYVALIHGGNTSSRPGSTPGWHELDIAEIHGVLGNDLELYQSYSHPFIAWVTRGAGR